MIIFTICHLLENSEKSDIIVPGGLMIKLKTGGLSHLFFVTQTVHAVED